jgi:hypothetical protein
MYRPSFYRDLRRQYQSCGRDYDKIEELNSIVLEAFRTKQIDPREVSIQKAFVNLIENGQELLELCDPRNQSRMLTEAMDMVDTTQFSNIIGQLVINKVLEGYQADEFVLSNEVETIDTKFSGERIPGIGGIGDNAEEVAEGHPYPTVGLNEDYIDTPATTKEGLIVPVTKEAIFFDRTQLVLQRAGEVGHFLGLRKEKRLWDCFLDVNEKKFKYKWRNTTYDTYQTSAPWVNVKAANGLADWTSVQAAELLLAQMLDPNTGEVITILPDTIVVPPALWHTAIQLTKATEVRRVNINAAGNAQTWTNGPSPLEANPLAMAGQYKVVSSRIMRQQAYKANTGTADTNWYATNLKKHVAYFQNWPITVVQAPQNSEAEFTQDIVVRFKASERGSPATLDPRYTVLSQA